MYEYVSKGEAAPYRRICSRNMEDLRDALYQRYGINTQFSLIGSGGDARNMITRNGNGPFDLDYNLYILSMPEAYERDLRRLKERIRVTLNEVSRLIHIKGFRPYYIWDEVPTSKDTKQRAAVLKQEGLWNQVREVYLQKKNMYLQRKDCSHSSYIIYAETVNEIYDRYFERPIGPIGKESGFGLLSILESGGRRY